MALIRTIKNLPRHFKSAMQNIVRNSVMSLSSILTVSFTLLLVSSIGIGAVNMHKMTLNVEQSLTIYAKVDRSLSDKEAEALSPTIEAISGVKSVLFSSKDQELTKLIESQNDAGKDLFETYRKNNPLGAAYTVSVVDASNIKSVSKKIATIEDISEVNYGGETTTKLIKTMTIIRNASGVLAFALVLFAFFLIVNTIKMAIEARNEEIKIMRLVGASNWYIRWPYMLEGMIIGFIGAILPSAVVFFGYPALYNASSKLLPSLIVLVEPYPFIMYVIEITVGLGVGVGVLGSARAVRKYLNH